MNLVNDCTECTAFDAETKALAEKLFSPDEITIVIFSLAAMMRFSFFKIKELSKSNDPKLRMMALRIQSEKDLATNTVGKLLNTLDENKRLGVEKSIEEVYGLRMNYQHEACPHGGPAVV